MDGWMEGIKLQAPLIQLHFTKYSKNLSTLFKHIIYSMILTIYLRKRVCCFFFLMNFSPLLLKSKYLDFITFDDGGMRFLLLLEDCGPSVNPTLRITSRYYECINIQHVYSVHKSFHVFKTVYSDV